jgi:hypothetical protein
MIWRPPTSVVSPRRGVRTLAAPRRRWLDVKVAYANWLKSELLPTTSGAQALYAENVLRDAWGGAPRLLPNAQGDGACGGTVHSLNKYLETHIDTEDVRLTMPTAAWTLGSSGHTTVQVDMSSADGVSSMHLGLDPFHAGVVNPSTEAGPSIFRLGPTTHTDSSSSFFPFYR